MKAATQLGLLPTDCVGFEDSPTGAASVKAAGMHCIAVSSSATEYVDLPIADEILESLADIDNTVFERLFGG